MPMPHRGGWKLRLHRLPLTPDTLHADWPQAVLDDLDTSSTQALELKTASDEIGSVCVRGHRCASEMPPSEDIMLPPTVSELLGVEAGAVLSVAVVTLIPVHVHVGTQHAKDMAEQDVAISSSLAGNSALAIGDNLSICPGAYGSRCHDVAARVAHIALNDDGMVPSIWLSPQVASNLGLKRNDMTYVYRAASAPGGRLTARVVCHPGFVYLSPRDAAMIGPQGTNALALESHEGMHAYAQPHPPLTLKTPQQTSYLDSALADSLRIRTTGTVLIQPLAAALWWASREPLDDLHNKARAAVGLRADTLAELGYVPQETVRFYHGQRHYTALIETTTASLHAGYLGLTPLLLRRAHITPREGVFLSTEHEPLALAEVGIFTVEEVGSASAKGSEHLGAAFPMPCRVELRNPKYGTSLDILLEPDPYPKPNAMVRLPRAARDLLLLQRGDQVIVKPIPTHHQMRSLGALGSQALHALSDGLLRVLIGRRRINMSVAPGHTWDDQARVARVAPEALAVLGVEEGDRLRIFYRGNTTSRTILARDVSAPPPVHIAGVEETPYNLVPAEFQIGLDALARIALADGELEFGTVVEVERDMGFVLRKSLNLTILPIVGTVITVVTLFAKQPLIVQAGVAALLATVFFYLALSVERSKVQ